MELKKPEKAKGKLEGADVGGRVAWRSVEHVPLNGAALELSARAVPSCEAPQDKAPEPLPEPQRTSLKYPRSTVYRPLMPSKEHASPSGNFVLGFSSGIPAFPTGEAQFVGTNAAFIGPTCIFGKKQSDFRVYSPSWSLKWQQQTEGRLGKNFVQFCFDYTAKFSNEGRYLLVEVIHFIHDNKTCNYVLSFSSR